jgi:vacuolar-type H+-ATPase subunit E/Vma4
LKDGLTAPDLEGFKRALLIQHQKRCVKMKREADEDLADIITTRRIEVEKIVHDLRRACEKRLAEGLRNNRRCAELQKKIRMSELQKGFFEHLEELVRSRVEAFRRSPRYESAMRNLALEALEHFPFPAIALVEKGDAACLSALAADTCQGSQKTRETGEIREIREELRDVWGGLVLVEAGKERGRLLDNTFRTRWRRLHTAFAEKLWEEIHEGIYV